MGKKTAASSRKRPGRIPPGRPSADLSSPDRPETLPLFAALEEPRRRRVETPTTLTAEPAAAELERLLTTAMLRRRFPGGGKVQVLFRPFRSTLYCRYPPKNGVVRVHLHLAFRRAPRKVLEQLGELIFCDSARRARLLPRDAYDAFVAALPPEAFSLPGARSEPKGRGERGRHRSLRAAFDRVNVRCFNGALTPPDLRWSPKRSRRTLGSYQHQKDRLIVSRVFDSPRVPLYVLDYLIYHELLHKFLGEEERVNGRRRPHHRLFKELERRFERYAEAEAFLRKL